MKMKSLEDFVCKQKELLALEKNAEVDEMRDLRKAGSKELESRGLCLNKLKLQSTCTGLFGRTIAVYEASVRGRELPSHSITSGDIVGVNTAADPNNLELTGVITKVSPQSISVAFEEGDVDQDDGSTFRLVKLANDVTYRRLQSTLERLKSRDASSESRLVGMLFNEQPLSAAAVTLPSSVSDGDSVRVLNSGLDQSQLEAVDFALKQNDLAIIHGPPGTGKTTTVVEIICQEVKMGRKVVACAPSNVAVDNLVERLSKHKINILRLGHPARVLKNIQKYSLDAIVANSEETALVRDIQKEIDDNRRKLNSSKDKGARYQIKKELTELRKELRVREKTALTRVLRGADIVLGTLTTVHQDGPLKYISNRHFHTAVIDECSQAIEVACWAPILMVDKVIIAGDHHQLPPTICSNEAAKEGLEVTLMERLLEGVGESCVKMLNTQYRMHQDIMQWSSQQFYEGKLIAHESVATHSLLDLPSVNQDDALDDISCAMVLIDTAGCDMFEMDTVDGPSKGNQGEAELTAQYVDDLVKQGLAAKDIAVIAPYNLQVELIRQLLTEKYPALEVKSVDGFQGREKEAVVISLTRSNSKREVGFLSEYRRINVAITRARRHVCVICDSETVTKDEHLDSLIQYMMEHADVRTARQSGSGGEVTEVTVSSCFEALDITKKEGSQTTKEKTALSNETVKARKSKPSKSQKDNQGKTLDGESSLPEEHTEKRRLEQQLLDFLGGAEGCISFPASLSSFERRYVHELAEEYDLIHESRGEGMSRFIRVTKKGVPTEGTGVELVPKAVASARRSVASVKDSLGSGASAKEGLGSVALAKEGSGSGASAKEGSGSVASAKEGSGSVALAKEASGSVASAKGVPESGKPALSATNRQACKICGKIVPDKNILLHELRCSKVKENEKRERESKEKPTKTKKPKEKRTAEPPPVAANANFDEMVENFAQQDNMCGFARCKTKVTLFAEICRFCRRKFCLSHNIPEVHGCGQHARNHARQQVQGGPQHADPNKRAQLQKKLNKKLAGMEDKRKGGKQEKR